MTSLREQIEAAVTRALVAVMGPEGAQTDPVVRPTQDPKFGDFQSNVALPLAKRLDRKSRDLAEEIVRALQIDEMCEPPEIAGPGFINFRIRPSFLAQQLSAVQADSRLGIAPVETPERVIVDFPSPNLAKEMHIGHLRPTVIGDAIARLMEFQGHQVLRLNHVGDWGTQFGMLVRYVRDTHPEALEQPEQFRIDDLEEFYRAAKERYDQDPAFAEAARQAVVDLQSGDPATRQLWEVFCGESLNHCHEILDRMGVQVEDRGESLYNPFLSRVIEDLEGLRLAVENQGAVCVFLEGWTNKEGEPLPVIIRKSDGGFMYATTDLAGLRYRINEDRATRIIYVTDIRQKDHFDQVFAVSRKAGWVPEGVRLEHVGFGMVLGKDGRPFKTSKGGTVKLKDVLEEAEARAASVLEKLLEQNQERLVGMTEDEKAEIAAAVGRGAIKYFDLSHNLASDYVFDWDTMLALQGNTAVYMLYAYARAQSIERKAGVSFESLPSDLPLVIEHESEIALAKQLLGFSAVLKQVATELRPHHLTDYLYALARAYSAFYDRERGVRIINAEPEAVRLSRLRLCDLTARTLRLGLDLLGIQVVERM